MLFAQWNRIDNAWHIVGAGFLVSLLTAGTRFATGPFMSSMMESFGMSHTEFSSIVALSLLIYGLFMPVAGRLADLLGGRLVLATGGVLLSLSLLLTATTESPVVFALAFSVLSSLGFAATSHVSLSSVLGRWFIRRRGLAMTFLSSGAMGGIAIMVPLSAALISRLGWRGTMLTLTGVILLAVLACAAVVGAEPPEPQDTPAEPGARESGRSEWKGALGSRPFWMLALSFFACGLSMNLLGTHGVAMLEHHGFSTMTAAYSIGMIGIVSVFGTLAIGAASDRLGRKNFLALIYGVRGLGFLGLAFVGHEWELYTVTAVGGLVWAGSSALTSAITADQFGARSVGTLFGLIFLSHQVGAAAGSLLGGWGFDTFGSYTMSFVVTAFVLVAAAALSLRLPERAMEPVVPQAAVGD